MRLKHSSDEENWQNMLIGGMIEKTATKQERSLDLLVEQRRTRKEIMKLIQKMTPIFPRDQGNQNERYFQYALGYLTVMLLQEEMQEEETLLQKERPISERLKPAHIFNE